jgi:hypothetical protein
LKTTLLFAALLATTSLLSAGEDPCAQPSPQEMAGKLGIDLPKSPWHLANIWWDLDGEVKDFESYTQTVHIDRDVPETYNLYIAPVGVAKINGLQFYGGLQTNINGWADKQSRERVHPGRGGIFSRWSSDKKTPIGLDHVKTAAPECLVESAGYEGEFASVRRPIPLTKGTWTYQIRKAETETIGDLKHTWFECRIQAPDGNWHPVGKLRFEGESFTYWPRHSAFVEVYSTAKIPNSHIPKVKVTFGWPHFNGEPARIKKVYGYYPNEHSQASPDCAVIEGKGENIVVDVGPIFKRDEQLRRHDITVTPPPVKVAK